jgi:hypothetical protein
MVDVRCEVRGERYDYDASTGRKSAKLDLQGENNSLETLLDGANGLEPISNMVRRSF